MTASPDDGSHLATCRCGAVRLRASGRPLVTGACHCEGCRRMTGGPYSLGAIYPTNAVTIEAGELMPIGADPASGHKGRARCASWVLSQPPALGDITIVRASLFADADRFAPFVESFTCEQLPFVGPVAPHRFERFPDPADFPTLMAAYATWEHAA